LISTLSSVEPIACLLLLQIDGSHSYFTHGRRPAQHNAAGLYEYYVRAVSYLSTLRKLQQQAAAAAVAAGGKQEVGQSSKTVGFTAAAGGIMQTRSTTAGLVAESFSCNGSGSVGEFVPFASTGEGAYACGGVERIGLADGAGFMHPPEVLAMRDVQAALVSAERLLDQVSKALQANGHLVAVHSHIGLLYPDVGVHAL
jgi:hypothetical protein